MLHPHPRQAPIHVPTDAANFLGHLLLLWDGVVNREWCQHHWNGPPQLGGHSGIALSYLRSFSRIITLAGGGGGLSSTSQYHPCIRIQSSFARGGSDARVASTSVPTFPVRCWWSDFRLSQIFLPISQTRRWSLWGYRRSATLVSLRHHVSADIHLFLHFYLGGGGLGVAQHKYTKHRSSWVCVLGRRRGNRLHFPR